MVDECWIGKDLEGRGRSVIEVLPPYLSEGTEENHENNVSQDYLCLGRD
jgi:hypothetical protein